MSSAWVFPGQGSQRAGVARALYDRFPGARAVFDAADEILGFGLTRLCIEGLPRQLAATEDAPSMQLTMSVAILAALGWGQPSLPAVIEPPVCVGGYALGEYAALVAARALDFETALRLVRLRGKLSAQEAMGTRAAVANGLREAIEQAPMRPAVIPVVASVTGQPLVDATAIRAELIAQMAAPNRWRKVVEYMIAQGVDRFIEIGPGTGLVGQLAPNRSA